MPRANRTGHGRLRLLPLMMAAVMALSLWGIGPKTAKAAPTLEYDIEDGHVVVTVGAGAYCVQQGSGSDEMLTAPTDYIQINQATPATASTNTLTIDGATSRPIGIVLNGLNLTTAAGIPAIELKNGANVNLMLKGDTAIAAVTIAVHVPAGCTLSITATQADDGTLTATTSGIHGTVIGGRGTNTGDGESSGTINIGGYASVTATTNDEYSTAIGGGYGTSSLTATVGGAATVNISDQARVNATTTMNSSTALGGGRANSFLPATGGAATIAISGNAQVSATAQGDYSTAMGGGYAHSMDENATGGAATITLSGTAKVSATAQGRQSTSMGGGIGDSQGGGATGGAATITLSGTPTVRALAGNGVIAMGGGIATGYPLATQGKAKITIAGGFVTASSGTNGRDIGSLNATAATDNYVHITGGSVLGLNATPANRISPAPSDGTDLVYPVRVPTAVTIAGTTTAFDGSAIVYGSYQAHTVSAGTGENQHGYSAGTTPNLPTDTSAILYLPENANTAGIAVGSLTNGRANVTATYTMPAANDDNLVTFAALLQAGTASRTAEAQGSVGFTSPIDGAVYVAVVEEGASAPTIDTNGAGTPCVDGQNTVSLSGLTAGAKDVYLVVKYGSGELTDVLKMTLPAYVAPPTVAVSGVALDVQSAALLVGQTQQLTATLAPANATNQGLIWSTSDAALATVDQSGLVTAHAAGSVTITVTTADGEFTDTCVFTLSDPVTPPLDPPPTPQTGDSATPLIFAASMLMALMGLGVVVSKRRAAQGE